MLVMLMNHGNGFSYN